MSVPEDERAALIGAAVANAVREHSTFFIVEGVILVLLGALAIFLPLFATITITIIVGWIFLASGIFGLITTFGMRGVPGFWWSLVSALIAIGAGVVLLMQPITGALSLTLILIVFFVVEASSASCMRWSIGESYLAAGSGCLSAASLTSCLPVSCLRDSPAPQLGLSGCLWGST